VPDHPTQPHRSTRPDDSGPDSNSGDDSGRDDSGSEHRQVSPEPAHQHAADGAHLHRHGQQPSPAHPESSDPAVFWEEFYGPDRRPWTGRPNALLVDELAQRPLPAGSVLDLGCGSGGDAIWFAQQEWSVTAVDISAAALTLAADAAATAGVGDRITFVRHDLDQGAPAGQWQLVVASYLQSPVALDRDQVLRRAAGSVAPGGTLLVLGHEGFPSSHEGGHPELPTTADVLAALDLTGWTTERAEPVAFDMPGGDGGHGQRWDHVIRLRRDLS
jgi:SAM-dependent methyltransferase